MKKKYIEEAIKLLINLQRTRDGKLEEILEICDKEKKQKKWDPLPVDPDFFRSRLPEHPMTLLFGDEWTKRKY